MVQEKFLDLLKRAKPLLGPISRDAVNLSWILDIHSSSLQTGIYTFQSLERAHLLPMVDGHLLGSLEDSFDMLSFYKTTKNALVHTFKLPVPPELPLRKANPVWINLESLSFNLKEFFRKIEDFGTAGFVEVEDRIKKERGYIFLYNGLVVSAKVGEEEGDIAFKRILRSLSENACLLNIYELNHITLEFLLSKPKLLSCFWDFEDAERFLKEISKRHAGSPALLVSVSLHEYGYRMYMDGEVIYEEGFDTEALFFEIYAIKSFAELNFLKPEDYISEHEKIKVLKSDEKSTIIYFCPACWSVVSGKDITCPNCGYDLTEFHNMPYEYKLLMGLEHPVVEMRMNVIHTVGVKDLKEALPQLEYMINKESNPMLLMAVVDALAKMSHPEALDLLRKLAHHTYPIIRSRAKYALEKKLTGGRRSPAL
ncbi:HEAT repeat domain-containing protein [Hydrogenobacter thermophilus]|uniref:HEAT repeat domain-containing protein n=1 Tax=Hydrogenobacter thermophilus TaxID=940 RepID=UPI0026EE80A8|nr:HEAT repeat domain-containing protein [Hydrogenobacter thermophilus]